MKPDHVAALRLSAEQELDDFKKLIDGRKDAEEELAIFRKNINERLAGEIADINKDEFGSITDAIESFANGAAQEFANLALAGELSAESIGKAFARLALQIAIKQFVTGPLETFFSTAFGGKAGGGKIRLSCRTQSSHYPRSFSQQGIIPALAAACPIGIMLSDRLSRVHDLGWVKRIITLSGTSLSMAAMIGQAARMDNHFLCRSSCMVERCAARVNRATHLLIKR